MSTADWAAWFDRARAEGAGGDLALLADEAPDAAATVAARVAAFEALRAVGAHWLAALQLNRLSHESPEAAEKLQSSIDPNEEPPSSVALAVVLAGHMIDAADRTVPRFSESSVAHVSARIRASLATLGVHPGDRAITSAAAGGDLLLAEAALQAGMALTVCLPFEESRFIESSLSFAGDEWMERFARLTQSPGVLVREMPPPGDDGANPYERANLWMVYLALASGARNVRGLVIWDGKSGDGPGGAAHMHRLLVEHGIPADVIAPVPRSA